MTLPNAVGRTAIPRHRTALSRTALSKPIRFALTDGILAPGLTLFDYGCGRGSDVGRLRDAGYSCTGWDPKYSPDEAVRPADIVNLGYVVNVIEAEAERRDVLARAWALTERTLIVTARLRFEELGQDLRAFADGYLTTRGTFQKFYEHGELRGWLADALGVEPIAAAPGMFYVFRDEQTRESFLAGRQRRLAPSLRPRGAELLFDQHRALFDEVLPFFSSRGRLPSVRELPEMAALLNAIPRVDTLLRVLRKALGADIFDRCTDDRRQDLLVYLALAKFDGRPPLRRLPDDVQLDVRSLFASYNLACLMADDLLLTVGRRENRDSAFSASPVGKLTANALYVHVSAIPRLPTVLRLYEGCARALVGAVDGATLIKLHRFKHQVSYLAYPRFDSDGHPTLMGSLVVRLQERSVKYWDYGQAVDPPILHRKELFVAQDYPKRRLFSALTAQEERRGLLTDVAAIGAKAGWARVLNAHGLEVRGHRLVRTGVRQ